FTSGVASIGMFAAENFTGTAQGSYATVSTTAIGTTSRTERLRVTDVGNVRIGGAANRAPTEGTNELVLFKGTPPAGSLTNGPNFYAACGEMRVMDGAGNSTLISPHDHSTNEWIFYSANTVTGKVLRIDVEKMLRYLNAKFGTDFVHEFFSEAEARPDLRPR